MLRCCGVGRLELGGYEWDLKHGERLRGRC
jgi:hypothetical protein